MQEVIVIFDKYGYGGLKTVTEVVAVPSGHCDARIFEMWVKYRAENWSMTEENVRAGFAYISCSISELPKEIIG